MTRTMTALGAAVLLAAHQAPPCAGAEGTLDKLKLGEHWYGAEIDKKDLRGKVVLYQIWGSCVGCKAITPPLIKFAKKIADRPVHIIFSHCQRVPRETVVAYLRSRGLPADQPNFTVTSFGSYPLNRRERYIPYYLLFDHHGDLVCHHMCGQWHGGDGLRCLERVEELLKAMPDIYLGREPFEKVRDLADKVASGRGLGPAAAEVAARLRSGKEDKRTAAELERLSAALTENRDRRLEQALSLVATRPSQVLPALGDLEKAFTGSALAEPVTAKIAGLKGSAGLSAAIAMEKQFVRYAGLVERFPPCRECKRRRHEAMRPDCAGCRTCNASLLDKIVERLGALADGNPDLPIAKTVRDYAGRLKGGRG